MSSLIPNLIRSIFLKTGIRHTHGCPQQQLSPPWDKHDGGYKVYKGLAFVAIPVILGLTAMLYLKRSTNEEERVPFAKYEYMRLRSKPFPWGDGSRSLLHNPKVNALPEGYEDEVEPKAES